MRAFIKALLPVFDVLLTPFLIPAAILMRILRRVGVERMPICRKVLSAVGVFPVADQYYEPLTNFSLLTRPLDEPRNLPGIDMNVTEQLELLKRFHFGDELRRFTTGRHDELTYCFDNNMFAAGDAEFLYNLVRCKKPRRVVEIGSGSSTLLVIEAIKKNKTEQETYMCQHTCIEPYEMPWLERSGVTVRRDRVESVEKSVFQELEAGDLLFIDSSHIIRPQGDVVCEFLEILPILKKGVIVHIHDIFTPRDYPHEWVVNKVRFWNEQYLLEALLSGNQHWEIIGSVNFLFREYHTDLKLACPFLTLEREPGSFYIEKLM